MTSWRWCSIFAAGIPSISSGSIPTDSAVKPTSASSTSRRNSLRGPILPILPTTPAGSFSPAPGLTANSPTRTGGRPSSIDVERPDQKRPGAAADTFRVETDLLDPEVQFRKGRALMAEGNYRDALEQLSYASDLDPQNGNYRAELAHCRYLFNPQTAGPLAISELEKALRIDPRSGLAHFYQGEILCAMGLIEEAQEAYRRAIKPMSPDRRPIDALRNLPRVK